MLTPVQHYLTAVLYQCWLTHVWRLCNLPQQGGMLDFIITEQLNDSTCTPWLERHLRLDGLNCPDCGSMEERLSSKQGHFPADGCRVCQGYYTLLTGTVLGKSRQRPAILVQLRRIAMDGAMAHIDARGQAEQLGTIMVRPVEAQAGELPLDANLTRRDVDLISSDEGLVVLLTQVIRKAA